MWDEIMDMPGEIFDITDETRDEMAAAWEWQDPCTLALETDKILMDLMTV